jgi:hypothetical protein
MIAKLADDLLGTPGRAKLARTPVIAKSHSIA